MKPPSRSTAPPRPELGGLAAGAAVVDADAVEAAARRLAGVVPQTPLHRSARLSSRVDGDVWVKREDLQSVRSYKVRGAYNFLFQLSDRERSAGVVCASAGNHGQGLAYACKALGVQGRIYVPRTTPRQKRDRISAVGGEMATVEVIGDTYDDAADAANADAGRSRAIIVPAFDDPRIIAGQGTVVSEAIAQLGVAPDLVVLPVGGGGLIAGALAWLQERHPSTAVIGVEPSGAACMARALEAGGPYRLDDLDSFVDGAAVRRAGELPFEMVRRSGADLVQVPEGRVCTEMLEYYQTDGIVAEPAGALAAAALGSVVHPPAGTTTVIVLSGGNNDVSRYAEVVERALVYEGRKHYFLIDFPQEPGALRLFLDTVLGPDDDITLFEYVKRSNRETGPALVGIELARAADLDLLLKKMRHAPHAYEKVLPQSPLFRFLL